MDKRGVILALKTREEWLTTAYERLIPTVEKHGKVPDTVHTICSWPSGSIRKIVGECYKPEWTGDGSIYITISPMLRDPRQVLHTMLHEMVHAIGQKGHGKKFQAVCHRIGLITESSHSSLEPTDRSPELELRFTEIIQELGDYPHVQLKPPAKKTSEKGGEEKKKPYIKLFDPVVPEYWIYMPIKVYEKYGAPACQGANSNKLMEVVKDEDSE